MYCILVIFFLFENYYILTFVTRFGDS